MNDLFRLYLPAHAARLSTLLGSAEWRELASRKAEIEACKASMRLPPKPPSQLTGAANYLLERNAERVQSLVRAGERDEDKLVEALGDWSKALEADPAFPILFLGLVLTLDCCFDPRCIYCNQAWAPRRMELEDWKRVLAEAAQPTPPYVYLTGGEPLILGKEVWGKDGLVEFAVGLGCAVNLNTNAVDISPEVALRLVEAGLFKVHVSLDSADAEIQDRLLAAPGRFDAVCRGIHNLQIARALLGAGHPQIHINCVLTRQNLSGFPELVRFLLEMRQTRSEEFKGKLTEDPTFQDFALHLVPVGGRENAHLRPRQAEWKTFYTQIWDEAEQVWQDYQDRIGVPAEEKKTLADHIPFANPFRRVDHGMELDEYCEAAAEGIYWQGALMPRCHVVPSQAFVLPDGSQHWCGAHAIRRPNPLGNVLQTTLRENIRRNLDRLPNLPNEFCPNCAGATCVINQTIERKLRERIAALLAKDE